MLVGKLRRIPKLLLHERIDFDNCSLYKIFTSIYGVLFCSIIFGIYGGNIRFSTQPNPPFVCWFAMYSCYAMGGKE